MAKLFSVIDRHPQKDQIIANIAAGWTLDEIARATDPPVDRYAIHRYKAKALAKMADKAREPVSTPSVSKQWVEAGYVDIFNRAKEGKRVDLAAARAALDSLARLNGYDAPKRSESVTFNLHALGSSGLTEQLAAALHALPSNERNVLLQAEPAIAAECEAIDVSQS